MGVIEELRRRIQDVSTATDHGRHEASLIALPPVDRELVGSIESQLGFSLPPLLTEFYCNVANGGVGPGYGAFRIHAQPQTGDLVETYEQVENQRRELN